ncbi:MAG: hypothetical protein IKP20_04815 [Candidatus Methanomethylophilaceae archaeon]|nr:hypothetical protein [Candidatus Methanomethylophilaceae archaeon]
MRTGIIVLGQNSDSPGGKLMAEECAEYLISRGRKNVRIAYHKGSPNSSDVISEMCHKEGIKTFSILPLAISEGQTTVWDMPKRLSLPDNAGSWTILDGTEIATRFSTALGFDPRMAEAIRESLGEPREGDAALLIAHGSKMSHCRKDMESYSEFLEDKGWPAAVRYSRIGEPDAETAIKKLISDGAKRITAIPMFVSFDGPSAVRCAEALKNAGAETRIADPISHLNAFKEILDSKVPEDWRRLGSGSDGRQPESVESPGVPGLRKDVKIFGNALASYLCEPCSSGRGDVPSGALDVSQREIAFEPAGLLEIFGLV